MRQFLRRVLAGLASAMFVAASPGACTPRGERSEAPRDTLTVSAYSVVREAYSEAVIPAFARAWRDRTGREVTVEASYGASGAQSRAVVEGFEADVVAFSMPADVDRVKQAGLITGDWSGGVHRGIVTRSIVAIGVRRGNPKAIAGFGDLARGDVSVLLANPKTSGAAVWSVAALFGAGRLAHAPDDDLLASVIARVEIMDRSGRDSMQTFERGIGDAVVTYENELVIGRRAGETYEEIVPPSTLRIENPAAVVDRWADKHGRRALAEAFLAFLTSPEAQRAMVEYGLRPVDPDVERETMGRFPEVPRLFTMKDLGGFSRVTADLFGATGAYTRALARAEARR